MVAPPKPWRRTDPRKSVGRLVGGLSQDGILRSSNAITRLRRMSPDAAEAVELCRDTIGRLCTIHGHLDDPILTLLGEELAFVCPQCSSPEVFAAWQAEPIEPP